MSCIKQKAGLTALEAPSLDTSMHASKVLFYKKLARQSLIAILAFLLLQFSLIFLKDLTENLQKKLIKGYAERSLRNTVDLFGRQEAVEKPIWSRSAFFSGSWQKAFDQWFNAHIVPLKPKIIKLGNHIYYALFSKSYMQSGNIIIGKHRYLYELSSVEKYYNLQRQSYDQATLDRWADDLQALSNFFHQRGQTFIYMITPSKASYYPEHLPTCQRCGKIPPRPDYQGLTATLKKRRINFLDASDLILSARTTYEPYLFPKGGFHWTQLSSALAARELMKHISTQHPLPELKFTYRAKPKAEGEDADGARLLNLISTPKSYPTPEVFIQPLTPITSKPLKIAIISGSFMFSVANILVETQLFHQIDFFFYWQVDHYRYRSDKQVKPTVLIQKFMPAFESLGIQPKTPHAYDDILNADVVILEENEPILRSNHFKAFFKKYLEPRKAL